jgi:hypothetical protein
MVLIVSGGFVLSLSLQRLVTDRAFDAPRLLVALSNGAVGAGLTFWGWSRLRRAKAGRPDLTWWQFLYHDLILLGVGGVILAVVAAIPPEELGALVRSLLEVAEALRNARGHP